MSAIHPLRASSGGATIESMFGLDPSPIGDLLKSSRYYLTTSHDEDDEPKSLAHAHWWVQPRWAKIMSVTVGVPSWLYLWFTMDTDPFTTLLGKIAVGAFFSVAALQMIFIFRGYWRMDI